MKEMEVMFDPTSNYKNYRDRLDILNPPLIPFEGWRPLVRQRGKQLTWISVPAVILADLTFIDEVPSFLKDGQVNFEKMHLIGKVIGELERYQVWSISYRLTWKPLIMEITESSLHLFLGTSCG